MLSLKHSLLVAVNRFLQPLGLELRRRQDKVDAEAMKPTLSAALQRTVARSIEIRTIIDVGASNGSWTASAQRYFPHTHALLIEANPYHHEALEQFCMNRSNVGYILAAAGDKTGEIFFDAKNPLGGQASHVNRQGDIRVPVTTVDVEVAQRHLTPPFLLKLDTHGFEVPILEGARTALQSTNLIVIETYNFQLTAESLRFYEMCSYLEDRGFRPIDVCDILFRPADKALWQFDLIFARADRDEFQNNTYESTSPG